MTRPRNYLLSAPANILGVFADVISLDPGLNIISGENGTLKTRFLSGVKAGPHASAVAGYSPRIVAISPKRNAERRESQAIMQYLRTKNVAWDKVLAERLGSGIDDSSFQTYHSLADLFHLIFAHRCKDGRNQIAEMTAVEQELNTVIQKVFPQYSLEAEWDKSLGHPNLTMRKHGGVKFPVSGLSLGELEVLSLVAFVYVQREEVDVYLVDEPEVHLNWHLEERLFSFLKQHCVDHKKQMIVVTHSRTIFLPAFFPLVQFFYWDSGKVKCGKKLTDEQRMRLAGDVVNVLNVTGAGCPVFHVEDSSHRRVIQALATISGKPVLVNECGNSPNVKSLFEYNQTVGGWADNYFLVDGDNQGNPYPGEARFIHLPYYCIENALLEPSLVAAVCGKSEAEIQKSILDIVKNKRKKFSKGVLFFESLIDRLTPGEMTFDGISSLDGSLFMPDLAKDAGMTYDEFISKYLTNAQSAGKLAKLFPKEFLDTLGL